MQGRKGLSSVFGFLAIFMLLMAGLAAAASFTSSQDAVWKAQEQARQVENSRALEHLTLSLNGSSLTVTNDGLVPSQLEYLLRSENGSTTDSRLTEQLQVGSQSALPVTSQLAGYAVVTNLGNVFSVHDPSQLQAATLPVTFDVSGLPSNFNSSSILIVDGQASTYAQLPRTYEWQPGSYHTFSFSPGLSLGPSERVGWASARGLEQARNGTLTVSQPGTIVSQYEDQYLLTVVGGGSLRYAGSPGGDGWYDAGTTAQVSTSYSWNETAGQSRQNLVSWDFDGSSSAPVPRSGNGIFEPPGVVMDSPHTLYLNGVTQYSVSVVNDVPSGGTTGALVVSYSYDSAQTTVAQGFGTNSNFESGSTGWFSESLGSACSASNPATVVTTYSHSPSHSAQFVNTYGQDQCLFQWAPLPSLSQPSYVYLVSAAMSGWTICPSGAASCGGEAYSGAGASCLDFANGFGSYDYWSQFSVTIGSNWCQGGSQDVGMLAGGDLYVDDLVLTYTYFEHMSSSASSSPNSFAVSGGTVTYSYGTGFGFPSGSSSTTWSSSWPSTEAYSASTCSGPSISGDTISGTGGPCVLTTTYSGSYSSSIGPSQTGDGWYDAGSSVQVSATASGPFSFGSWSVPSGLSISGASSPSATLTVNGYGTAAANINVGQ